MSATLAYPTGKALIPYGVNRDLMTTYFPTHQMFATLTLVLAWVVVAMIIRAYLVSQYIPEVPSNQRVPYWTRFSTIVVAFGSAACAAYTSHLGVTMVWGNAV